MNALIAMSALVDDLLSVRGLAGGAMLSEATRRWVTARLECARTIWLEEIRRGKRDIVDVGQQDEVAAILFRYQRAAIEGTARLNLRLMVGIAAGQSERGRFSADEFLAWSDSIAMLRREELILLAEMFRAEREPPSSLAPRERDLWVVAGKWETVLKVVIPDPFRDAEEVQAAAAAALRSGLVTVRSGGFDDPVTYVTTSRLAKLIELSPIEDALGRDGYTRPSRHR